MKVAAPLAKNNSATFGTAAAASAIEAEIQKNTLFRNNNFNSFKQRIKRDGENRSSSWKF